jgi:hypothetical protein
MLVAASIGISVDTTDEHRHRVVLDANIDLKDFGQLDGAQEIFAAVVINAVADQDLQRDVLPATLPPESSYLQLATQIASAVARRSACSARVLTSRTPSTAGSKWQAVG